MCQEILSHRVKNPGSGVEGTLSGLGYQQVGSLRLQVWVHRLPGPHLLGASFGGWEPF